MDEDKVREIVRNEMRVSTRNDKIAERAYQALREWGWEHDEEVFYASDITAILREILHGTSGTGGASCTNCES